MALSFSEQFELQNIVDDGLNRLENEDLSFSERNYSDCSACELVVS